MLAARSYRSRLSADGPGIRVIGGLASDLGLARLLFVLNILFLGIVDAVVQSSEKIDELIEKHAVHAPPRAQ